MNPLTVVREVQNGKVVIDVPSIFGNKVEIIIRPIENIEFWTDEEIDKIGEVLTFSEDIDNEDYSKW